VSTYTLPFIFVLVTIFYYLTHSHGFRVVIPERTLMGEGEVF